MLTNSKGAICNPAVTLKRILACSFDVEQVLQFSFCRKFTEVHLALDILYILWHTHTKSEETTLLNIGLKTQMQAV